MTRREREIARKRERERERERERGGMVEETIVVSHPDHLPHIRVTWSALPPPPCQLSSSRTFSVVPRTENPCRVGSGGGRRSRRKNQGGRECEACLCRNKTPKMKEIGNLTARLGVQVPPPSPRKEMQPDSPMHCKPTNYTSSLGTLCHDDDEGDED